VKPIMKMRTPGNAVVTWIHTPENMHGNHGHWGKMECSGCMETDPQVFWEYANSHARGCWVMPD
jgi:hypothetical protein